MTGAGAADPIRWSLETDFLGGVGADPTYYEVGTNPQVQTAELSNNLLKIVAPDSPEARRYLAQQFEGQLGVSFILHNDEHHRLFAGGDTSFAADNAATAEWYLSFMDRNGNVGERQIQGWMPATYTLDYSTADPVRVTLVGPYADEQTNDSVTPTDADTITTAEETPFHGASLDVDGMTIEEMQSATLEVSNITRPIPGPNRKYVNVDRGAVETTLNHTAVYHDGSDDRTELAYGSTGATSPEDFVGGVSASFNLESKNGKVASYDLSEVTPGTLDWSDLANPDQSVAQPVTYQCGPLGWSDPTA